ncbi:MAG: prephenate dehydratase [Elusimicrobia bacterium]|nr:prephenate dehydratase [Elusimicrobiota bacterium]
MKAGYQGLRGAYSEEAALERFPGAEAVGSAFSEQVFEAVLSGAVDCGVLPVENSIAGPVAVNADLFLKHDVFITGESYLRIEHCLLGLPGAAPRTVFSHPVALAQCRSYIESHALKAVPEFDTAGSAELVASRRDPAEAAIASKRCAEAYGLSVLAEGIQSAKDNFTRFVVFHRRDRVPAGLLMEKTSLAFTAKHRPGALLDCLKRFAEQGLNLTRLESRPIPEDPFSYFFLVDLLGGAESAPVKKALAALEADAGLVKVLGSYPLAERPPRNR